MPIERRNYTNASTGDAMNILEITLLGAFAGEMEIPFRSGVFATVNGQSWVEGQLQIFHFSAVNNALGIYQVWAGWTPTFTIGPLTCEGVQAHVTFNTSTLRQLSGPWTLPFVDAP